MKSILTLFVLSLLNLNLKGQGNPTIIPNTLKTGTETTVTFSGGPINISNGTCIEVYLQQGTVTILQSASSVYYQASNVLVTSFYLASNTLTGAYNVIFYDYCKGAIIGTYLNKMSIALSSIKNEIEQWFGFQLFPNPVEKEAQVNILNESQPLEKNTIQVYSSQGKLLFHQENIGKEFKLKTEGWSTGTYYIQMMNEDGVSYSKKLEVR